MEVKITARGLKLKCTRNFCYRNKTKQLTADSKRLIYNVNLEKVFNFSSFHDGLNDAGIHKGRPGTKEDLISVT